MAQDSFSAQVDAWVEDKIELQDAIFKESVQRTIEAMQVPVSSGGNMPVDTGFLRASLQAALGDPGFSVVFKPTDGSSFTYNAGEVALVIASAHLGETITAVYTANYAFFVEYGTSKMGARRFVGLAAQQWPRIVSEVAAEARSGAG